MIHHACARVEFLPKARYCAMKRCDEAVLGLRVMLAGTERTGGDLTFWDLILKETDDEKDQAFHGRLYRDLGIDERRTRPGAEAAARRGRQQQHLSRRAPRFQ